MQRRALDYRTAQLYGLKVRHRRYDSRSSYLIRDLFEQCQLLLCGELIRDSPTGCLGGKTEFLLLGKVVYFQYDTIGRHRQVLALRVPVGDICHDLVHIVANLNGIRDMKSPLFGGLQPFEMRLAGQVLA